MNWIRTILDRVKGGKIERLECSELEDGMQGLGTLVPADEAEFWQGVSQVSLNEVWTILLMIFMRSYSKNKGIRGFCGFD